MRRVLHHVDLGPLQRDVALDLVLGEDVAVQQELVVGLERGQRLAERAADGRDLGQLLRRQVVEVLVRRRARVDLVADAVDAGHQQRREGEVGVGAGVGEAGLDALGLRALRPRDADRGRAVAGRVGAAAPAPRSPGSAACSCWSSGW